MATKNGNGNNGGHEVPTVNRKRITREDLTKSIEAAREAANAAANVAESALGVLKASDMPSPEGESVVAYEEFMARLSEPLRKAGSAVTVTQTAGWMKIESRRNGHKVYVTKGKTQVNRIESTLEPASVPGAIPAARPNGRIASWLPPDTRAVTEAIRHLAEDDEPIRPVRRGGSGSASGGRPRPAFN